MSPAAGSDGSTRVACGCNGGDRLDGHFGSCEGFQIYDVSADGVRPVELRRLGASPPGVDKTRLRVERIADCDLLFVSGIGGPAAARVVAASIHPIKVADDGDARARLAALQAVLARTPPPWLVRAMRRRCRSEREVTP